MGAIHCVGHGVVVSWMSNVISVVYCSSALLPSDELEIVLKIVIVQAGNKYLRVHHTFSEYSDSQYDFSAESWKGIFFFHCLSLRDILYW